MGEHTLRVDRGIIVPIIGGCYLSKFNNYIDFVFNSNFSDWTSGELSTCKRSPISLMSNESLGVFKKYNKPDSGYLFKKNGEKFKVYENHLHVRTGINKSSIFIEDKIHFLNKTCSLFCRYVSPKIELTLKLNFKNGLMKENEFIFFKEY